MKKPPKGLMLEVACGSGPGDGRDARAVSEHRILREILHLLVTVINQYRVPLETEILNVVLHDIEPLRLVCIVVFLLLRVEVELGLNGFVLS